MKSQFIGTGNSTTNGLDDYLGNSLFVLVADTRKGLSADTTARLEAMGSYVDANPSTTNSARFNAYKNKIISSAGQPQYTTTRTSTPSFKG